jgi:hypothetical protein
MRDGDQKKSAHRAEIAVDHVLRVHVLDGFSDLSQLLMEVSEDDLYHT